MVSVDNISDVKWMSVRLKAYVEAHGVKEVAQFMHSSRSNVCRFCSGVRMKMITAINLSDLIGLSIAELMLRPGLEDEIEWYVDASPEFLQHNLRSYAHDAGITRIDLACLAGITSSSINGYFCGRAYPTTDKLQSMADALGVEVADLFLPTE